jgi:quercetin dioxygenase-like cupin family protein
MIGEGIPFQTIDWSSIPEERHAGETGFATWRTLQAGSARLRVVEYSADYRADHWCSRGHVLFVLDGELHTEVEGGGTHILYAGMSYVVSNGVSSHRSFSPGGARLFIVD